MNRLASRYLPPKNINTEDSIDEDVERNQPKGERGISFSTRSAKYFRQNLPIIRLGSKSIDSILENDEISQNSEEIRNKIKNYSTIGNLDKYHSRNIYTNRYKETTKRFRGFWHLMLKWKGSVFKLIWHDLLIFVGLYIILSVTYRYYLLKDEVYREVFELICIYSSRFRQLIPITFLTGFYVTEVMRRYWDQFMSLPFPDLLALKLVSYIPGKDHFRRNLRRTVMRYVNLSIVLVFRLVSTNVHARFPTYKSLVDAKLLLPHEAERMMKVDSMTPHESTWTPILWAQKLLQRARTEGKITMDPPIYANLVSSFDYIEINNRKILNHGWVNFPLAYTQVATLSVFSYFFFSLFGSQYLVPHDDALDKNTFPVLQIDFSTKDPYNKHTPYMYMPYFTIIEFISYMGWIKVAETLLSPFGDDDEDLEINYLIDRNVQVSYMIVDDADIEIEMAKDPFLEAGIAAPAELPYQDENQRGEAARLLTEGKATTASRLRKISNWASRGSAKSKHTRMESQSEVDFGGHSSHDTQDETKPARKKRFSHWAIKKSSQPHITQDFMVSVTSPLPDPSDALPEPGFPDMNSLGADLRRVRRERINSNASLSDLAEELNSSKCGGNSDESEAPSPAWKDNKAFVWDDNGIGVNLSQDPQENRQTNSGMVTQAEQKEDLNFANEHNGNPLLKSDSGFMSIGPDSNSKQDLTSKRKSNYVRSSTVPSGLGKDVASPILEEEPMPWDEDRKRNNNFTTVIIEGET